MSLTLREILGSKLTIILPMLNSQNGDKGRWFVGQSIAKPYNNNDMTPETISPTQSKTDYLYQ